MLFLPEKIGTIFIMLGTECNCHCEYCSQNKYKEIKIQSINPDIFKFIDNILENQEEKIKMVFFGGEPLLHLDTIRLFCRTYRKKFKYALLTNGKLLSKDTIDFLNRFDANISISWDGRNSNITRHYDAIKEKYDLLPKIKNFYINAVLNHYSYPIEILEDIDKISKYYTEITGRPIGFGIDTIYNFELSNNDIFKIDLDKLKSQMNILYANYKNNNSEINDFYIKRIIDNLTYPDEITFYSSCQNGLNVLNLDLHGNLYLCHNNYDKKLGTIYSNIDEYTNTYNSFFNIQERFEKYCINCSIKKYCKGGCLLLTDEQMPTYCNQKLAHYGFLAQ